MAVLIILYIFPPRVGKAQTIGFTLSKIVVVNCLCTSLFQLDPDPLEGRKVRDDRSTGLRYISDYITGDLSGYDGISAFIDLAGET